MTLADHPTVKAWESKAASPPPTVVEARWLRQLGLEAGADDAGLVEIARPGLDSQRDEILRNYPWTKTLLSLVVRMAREPVRSAPRSVANLEFHRAGPEVAEICAGIVRERGSRGARARHSLMP